MTIRAQIQLSSELRAESADSRTLELDSHGTPTRSALAVLDHGTRTSAVRRAIAPPGRYLVVEQDGDEWLIPVKRPVVHIGRGITADVRLEDACISRRHAILAQLGDGLRILDTRSSNGTFVNDQPVTAAYLRDGDAIRLGSILMGFAEIASVHRPAASRHVSLATA
jgi:pSer/pThr/pTyr-binding forkhead associated (FHA) protein